jgi:hypothetical protein
MRLRRKDEKGAILALSTFIALGALMMAGLVMDLGQMRADRRVNKGYTDVAARAGIARLPFGPWSGVCKAREFLLGNTALFSSFDAGSEVWSNVATPAAPAVVKATNPCPAVATAPDAVPCSPNAPATWAKLQATAGEGRFTIMIQAGYVLPDPAFPNDTDTTDIGAPELGSCDNLAVVLSQVDTPAFAKVNKTSSKVVRVRSVGRLNATETLDFVAALQLLERNNCNVLQTGGANTRVIAQPYNTYPGTIQIDSIGDGSCPSPILNAQATSGGPSVLACSTNSTNPDCRPGTGTRPSRIGIYAINFNKPASVVSTTYSTTYSASTYGDTKAIPSPRTGRKYVDRRYRANVAALDASVKALMASSNHLPPGCTTVVSKTCIGNGITWLVLQPGNGAGADCNNLTTFFAVAGRPAAQNIWFDCDLNVTVPLTLTAANSYIVVTGTLSVNSALTITDPRRLYEGGTESGNKVGIDLTGAASILNVNTGGALTCAGRTGPGHANQLVVGKGSFKAASNSVVRLCQTFTYLASGYDKVPSVEGVYPCPAGNSCTTYSGTITVSSNAIVDLSAANEITGRLPEASELLTTNPFEDLGLWTEAGGNTNGLNGGAATTLRGVFFLPNADAFNLAGGGALPIDLSAQFVSTTLKVTGGATVNLVPNPEDSIPVTIYTTLLVR